MSVFFLSLKKASDWYAVLIFAKTSSGGAATVGSVTLAPLAGVSRVRFGALIIGSLRHQNADVLAY